MYLALRQQQAFLVYMWCGYTFMNTDTVFSLKHGSTALCRSIRQLKHTINIQSGLKWTHYMTSRAAEILCSW